MNGLWVCSKWLVSANLLIDIRSENNWWQHLLDTCALTGNHFCSAFFSSLSPSSTKQDSYEKVRCGCCTIYKRYITLYQTSGQHPPSSRWKKTPYHYTPKLERMSTKKGKQQDCCKTQKMESNRKYCKTHDSEENGSQQPLTVNTTDRLWWRG
jgi:hypothetical protein